MQKETIALLLLLFLAISCKKEDIQSTSNPSIDSVVIDSTIVFEITMESAKVSTKMRSNSGNIITQHGYVWSSEKNEPTLKDNKLELGAYEGIFPMQFESKLKDLEANKTYYVRAYITAGIKTTYNKTVTFKTASITLINDPTIQEVIPTLFLLGKNGLSALEPATGKVRWVVAEEKMTQETDRYRYLPVVSGEQIYTTASKLYAYEVASGKKRWEYQTLLDRPYGPFSDGKSIYFSVFLNQKLFALDAKNGQKKWDFQFPEGSRIPMVYNEVILVTARDKLYGIEERTGSKRWEISFGDVLTVTPCVGKGMVFVSKGSKLYAIDVLRGTITWEVDTGVTASVLSVSEENVYVLDQSGNGILGAIDIGTGKKKWVTEYADNQKTKKIRIYRFFSSDGNSNQLLYASGITMDTWNGDTVYYVFALNPKTGAVEWKIETNSLNLSGHLDGIVIKNIMYLSSVTGTVAYQFSEDNLSGETIWKSSSAGLPCFVDKNGKGYHLIESGMQQ